jgi:hypothetical protein
MYMVTVRLPLTRYPAKGVPPIAELPLFATDQEPRPQLSRVPPLFTKATQIPRERVQRCTRLSGVWLCVYLVDEIHDASIQ